MLKVQKDIKSIVQVCAEVERPQLFKCRRCGRLFAVSIEHVELVRKASGLKSNNFMFAARDMKLCCDDPRYRWLNMYFTVLEITDKQEGAKQ